MKKTLNRKQLDTLLECQCFAWKLRFIRHSLFQESVPVLYNTQYTTIGVLEPDGQINLDIELMVRSFESKSIQSKHSPQVQKAPEHITPESKLYWVSAHTR